MSHRYFFVTLTQNKNFNSLQKYRMRPIKWKGILHRLTIWNWKFSQHTPVESALKKGMIFSDFENYSKNARGMILFLLGRSYCTLILYKSAEKPTVIWLFTQNCFKSRVVGILPEISPRKILTCNWINKGGHVAEVRQECGKKSKMSAWQNLIAVDMCEVGVWQEYGRARGKTGVRHLSDRSTT